MDRDLLHTGTTQHDLHTVCGCAFNHCTYVLYRHLLKSFIILH